jgi:hypothetical protein
MDASSSVETIVGFQIGVERSGGGRQMMVIPRQPYNNGAECGSNVFADMENAVFLCSSTETKEFEELVSWSHCFWLHSLRFFRSLPSDLCRFPMLHSGA